MFKHRKIDATNGKVTDVKRRSVSVFARWSSRKIDQELPVCPLTPDMALNADAKFTVAFTDNVDSHDGHKSGRHYGSPCSIVRCVICGAILTVK